MNNNLAIKKWSEEGQQTAQSDLYRTRLAKGIEAFLILIFFSLAFWLGMQAWRNPLFEWPMLVISESALIGGPLWLWLKLQE